MCPRCKQQELRAFYRYDGSLVGDHSVVAVGHGDLTSVVCPKCGFLLFDEKWGWAVDILEKIEQFTQLAKQHGVQSEASLRDFLVEMEIPSSYLKGGAYYIPGGENEQESTVEE